MPRRKSSVKNKHAVIRSGSPGSAPSTSVTQDLSSFQSLGVVDLHFHGAFGVDLMTAGQKDLDELSLRLARSGVAAFCPTTLSEREKPLLEAVTRLGTWTRRIWDQAQSTREATAYPLGLHLEGPFISAEAAGAHPPGAIRPVTQEELDRLWEVSCGTLKILTVAPETLNPEQLRGLVRWCRARRIVLSAGHTRATQAQAAQAFAAGFTNVTHTWNAMAYHHRAPGVLGAALGNPEVFLEIIPDGIHVAPSFIRMTQAAHPKDRLCFVSDCVPAAGLPSRAWVDFGPLKIHCSEGACRLENGSLAGGGRLLSETYRRWLIQEARALRQPLPKLLKDTLPAVTTAPLASLGLRPKDLRLPRVQWHFPSPSSIRLTLPT